MALWKVIKQYKMHKSFCEKLNPRKFLIVCLVARKCRRGSHLHSRHEIISLNFWPRGWCINCIKIVWFSNEAFVILYVFFRLHLDMILLLWLQTYFYVNSIQFILVSKRVSFEFDTITAMSSTLHDWHLLPD